ncbi:hypothetical protein RDWZM_007080 [Blomia tropicalis]|uniref:ATP synthase-coupling factor 6, mitochondrial n=1 Tax=Blomia tropicalis TaxID=40697 RepID=A0A9Q0M7B2_BLOTA|nr:ATP synthesis coupled proton transport [Blomia tropicalis]KAJ6221268.1 hypothetical protein RDWZM_007080 [Blomia tropicalis]
MNVVRQFRHHAISVSKNAMIIRTATTAAKATATTASDPIQKLFLDKIREYATKSKSIPNGLVDSDATLAKQLTEEMERVGNIYGVKSEADIANLGLKFEETAQLDPINLRK